MNTTRTQVCSPGRWWDTKRDAGEKSTSRGPIWPKSHVALLRRQRASRLVWATAMPQQTAITLMRCLNWQSSSLVSMGVCVEHRGVIFAWSLDHDDPPRVVNV